MFNIIFLNGLSKIDKFVIGDKFVIVIVDVEIKSVFIKFKCFFVCLEIGSISKILFINIIDRNDKIIMMYGEIFFIIIIIFFILKL